MLRLGFVEAFYYLFFEKPYGRTRREHVFEPKAANLRIRPADTEPCPDFTEWLCDTLAGGAFTEEQARICLETAEDWVKNGI
jgi:hypothetical protein